MYFNSIIKILVLFCATACSVFAQNSKKEISLSDLQNDAVIINQSKMVWHTTLYFWLANEDGELGQKCYEIITDKRTREIRVIKRNQTLQFDQSLLKNAYSSADFRRFYGKGILKESLLKVDNNFFDLSNNKKMSALDMYILYHED